MSKTKSRFSKSIMARTRRAPTGNIINPDGIEETGVRTQPARKYKKYKNVGGLGSAWSKDKYRPTWKRKSYKKKKTRQKDYAKRYDLQMQRQGIKDARVREMIIKKRRRAQAAKRRAFKNTDYETGAFDLFATAEEKAEQYAEENQRKAEMRDALRAKRREYAKTYNKRLTEAQKEKRRKYARNYYNRLTDAQKKARADAAKFRAAQKRAEKQVANREPIANKRERALAKVQSILKVA